MTITLCDKTRPLETKARGVADKYRPDHPGTVEPVNADGLTDYGYFTGERQDGAAA